MEAQLKYFPKKFRIVFTFINAFYFAFFLVTIIVHLATQPADATCSETYTKEVWNGCITKVPFCKNPWVAKCDCAIMSLSKYSQRKLPDSFGQMGSLLRLYISKGRLTNLPETIDVDHQKLMSLGVVKTNLSTLPDKIVSLPNLLELYLFDNKLTQLPADIGKLKSLTDLHLFNNQLTSLPDSIGDLHYLGKFTCAT